MNELINKLRYSEKGLVLYSLTPPGQDTSEEKLKALNDRRLRRISSIRCDGLSIYDVQEENSRNNQSRTFQFKTAINPLQYGNYFKKGVTPPQLIYLVAGKYTEDELRRIFSGNPERAFVLVGSPDRKSSRKTSLPKAYEISRAYDNPIGGVLIGERHLKGNSEVERVLSKIDQGADFFISQCVYDSSLYKKFLRDYAVESELLGYEKKPLIFTFSPVGTERDLDFMEWLGVRIPRKFREATGGRKDFLRDSIDFLENTAEELIDHCLDMNIPFGVNFESVIGRRAEVLGSLELAERVTLMMERKLDQEDSSFRSFTRNLKSAVSALSSR